MMDTPDFLGLQIDSSHDISLNVHVFENDQAISGSTGNISPAILIGQYSEFDNVANLDLTAKVNNTGGTALKLSNTRSSRIKLIASNAPLATGNAHPVTLGILYGSGNKDDIHVDLLTSMGMAKEIGFLLGTNGTLSLLGKN